MQARRSLTSNHAETADGSQKGVGHDIMEKQVWIVNVSDHVSGQSANAQGKGENQPKDQQLGKSRRQRGTEPTRLPEQHHEKPGN
jgi:hypothetical protein